VDPEQSYPGRFPGGKGLSHCPGRSGATPQLAFPGEWGWEKITKYVLEPALPYQAIDVVLVNLDAWKKLPENIQDSFVLPSF